MYFYGTGNTMLDIQLQDWYGNNRGGTYKYFALDDASKRYRLQVIHLVYSFGLVLFRNLPNRSLVTRLVLHIGVTYGVTYGVA